MKISRHYSDYHLKDNENIESRIAVYEDQVRGWFLDQARILEKASDHGAFVLLLIVLSYIEAHVIFYKGEDSEGQSKAFFREGFKAIFPRKTDNTDILDKALNDLYREVRCGLFHTGMVRGKVILSGGFTSSFEIITDASNSVVQIQVNPHKALNEIEDHLARYLMRLRNPDEKQLRSNFSKAWAMRHQN